MRLTAHELGDTLSPTVCPTSLLLSGGVMRKPYNIPTLTIFFCKSLFINGLWYFGRWGVMRTRRQIAEDL